MAKTKWLNLLVLAAILISCAPNTTVNSRADNFSFIYRYISCGSAPFYVLDSSKGILLHTPLGETSTITISFLLTDDEMESIYQKAISVGFFDFPPEFVIPADQVVGFHAPSSTYELSMINGEKSNSVIWTDDMITKPEYKVADRLRELMDLIYNVIQSHPEIKQLPPPKAGCA